MGLGEVVDPNAGPDADPRGSGLDPPQDGAPQRGLARPVEADEGDAGLVGEIEADAGEDILSAVGDGQIVGRDQRHWGIAWWGITKLGRCNKGGGRPMRARMQECGQALVRFVPFVARRAGGRKPAQGKRTSPGVAAGSISGETGSSRAKRVGPGRRSGSSRKTRGTWPRVECSCPSRAHSSAITR